MYLHVMSVLSLSLADMEVFFWRITTLSADRLDGFNHFGCHVPGPGIGVGWQLSKCWNKCWELIGSLSVESITSTLLLILKPVCITRASKTYETVREAWRGLLSLLRPIERAMLGKYELCKRLSAIFCDATPKFSDSGASRAGGASVFRSVLRVL